MKKVIGLLFIILFSINNYAQNFEGIINYKVVYETKNTQITDHQWDTRLGTKQEYYYKNGDYKIKSNGTIVEWKLFKIKEHKIYNKIIDESSVFGTDVSIITDSIISHTINKDFNAVLGYTCDELILECKSGTQKYYFNSKLNIDYSLFVNHHYNNLSNYLQLTQALPLKMIIENQQYRMVSTAIAIEEKIIDPAEFNIPSNLKIIKVQ